MFSFHPDKTFIGEASQYSSGFQFVGTNDVSVISRIVTTFRHSGIIWNGGCRGKQFFKSSEWIMLDFDDGEMSLDCAVDSFNEFTHIIVTSKSHQKVKGKSPPCDRFHVYAKLPITVTNASDYTLLSNHWSREVGADMQCTDAARMFSPGIIVISSRSGRDLPVVSIKKLSDNKLSSRFVSLVYAQRSGNDRRWIEDLLTNGPDGGASRNTACFKIAVYKKKEGLSQEEVVTLLMNSAVPIGSDVINEVRQAVESAFRNT